MFLSQVINMAPKHEKLILNLLILLSWCYLPQSSQNYHPSEFLLAHSKLCRDCNQSQNNFRVVQDRSTAEIAQLYGNLVGSIKYFMSL